MSWFELKRSKDKVVTELFPAPQWSIRHNPRAIELRWLVSDRSRLLTGVHDVQSIPQCLYSESKSLPTPKTLNPHKAPCANQKNPPRKRPLPCGLPE